MLSGLAAAASAMVVVQRDFADLVTRAEQIVVGTVSAIRQDQDPSGAPRTLVTFGDLTVLKGDVGATLTLELYGGRVGAVAQSIPDMPSFTEGERAVLFVAGNGRDICPLVGVWQGRFRVRVDPIRGVDVVESHDGRAIIGHQGRALRRAPIGAPADAAPAVTVDAFRQLIAEELAHPTTADSPR